MGEPLRPMIAAHLRKRRPKPYATWHLDEVADKTQPSLDEREVERMNRTIKDATVKRYFYETHDQLHVHLRDFVDASKLSGASPPTVRRMHFVNTLLASDHALALKSLFSRM